MISRRSIRLKAYDYRSAGPYFLTLCSFKKELRFGSIHSGMVYLNSTGLVIQEEWFRTSKVRPEVTLDAFVIMPNHLHAVVIVGESTRSCLEATAVTGRPPRSLGSLVAGFKSACTVRVNIANGTPGRPLWQTNYYERVIRSENELDKVRAYISGNPARWGTRQ